jgi:hypothetical protein
MSDKPYTAAELKEFDRITLDASSPDQVRRVRGRLAVSQFVVTHGQSKCDAMWEAIQKRDGKR